MVARSRENEIRIVRSYDAALEDVWDAWTDPAQVAQWWGPRGFTLTTHSKELRAGGIWHYTMHGPDGVDFPNKTLYHEVIERQKLVYDHGGYDDRPPLFRVTVLFKELAPDKTEIEMTAVCPTPEAAAEMRKFIKQAGGDSTWDRLAEYLEHEQSGHERFVINRSFAAPIDVLFEMWTDPRQLAEWLPPVGFTMEFRQTAMEPGSRSVWKMTAGGATTFCGCFDYLRVERPCTIEYEQQFIDEQGNPSPHPLMPVWPKSLRTLVALAPEGPEQTRVTVVCDPDRAATPAELAAFCAEKAGMTIGWTGSFDTLETLLASG